MKRYFIYAIFLSSVLLSCKKDGKVVPPGVSTKHNVTFAVIGFSQTVAPFGTNTALKKQTAINRKGVRAATTDTLAEHIGVLYYTVTDSKGSVVSNFTQYATDSTFGTIKIPLNPGAYHLSAVGGLFWLLQGTNYQRLSINPDTAGQFLYLNGRSGQTTSFSDAFLKSMDFTVGVADSSYSITLNRVVAQVEVNIQDAIPANANHITVYIDNDHYLLKGDGTSEGSTGQIRGTIPPINNSISIDSLTTGATNTEASSIVLNTESAMSVIITCYDNNNNIIAQKTVTNVTCQANKTTLLTGDLFGGTTNNGINVNYNPAWSVQTINYSY